MIKAQKRIDEILDFCRLARKMASLLFDIENDRETVIADIACDHGFIGFNLLKNRISDKVIFSDISVKSLEKAINLIKSSEYLQFSEFRVGDGVDVLRENIFASIIAGVGGREIVKILKSNKINLSKFFILQTSQDDVFLRKELKENFKILCDKCMIDNGHVYHTFLVTSFETDNSVMDIDRFALRFFCEKNKMDFTNLKKDDILSYLNFNSLYYGKNNMIINSIENKNCIEFQIQRYTGLLLDLEGKNRIINNVSMADYIKELKLRLDALDKIKSSIL